MITVKDASKRGDDYKQAKPQRCGVGTHDYVKILNMNTRLKFFPGATYLPGLLLKDIV